MVDSGPRPPTRPTDAVAGPTLFGARGPGSRELRADLERDHLPAQRPAPDIGGGVAAPGRVHAPVELELPFGHAHDDAGARIAARVDVVGAEVMHRKPRLGPDVAQLTLAILEQAISTDDDEAGREQRL